MQITKKELDELLKKPSPLDLANLDLRGADLSGSKSSGGLFSRV